MLIENNREGTMGEHLNQQLHGEAASSRGSAKRMPRPPTVSTGFRTVYFYGVSGSRLRLLNDPNLGAPISPAPKANGGTAWFTADGHPNATANEVYNDIVALYQQLVHRTSATSTRARRWGWACRRARQSR